MAEQEGQFVPGDFIVVVEDNKIVNFLISEVVRDCGFEAISFETADSALSYILNTPISPKLVVTDHEMPGKLNGYEFACRIRDLYPGIPVILASGHIFIESLKLPEHVRLIKKPWGLKEFADSINELANR